jgi:hypothetical protein
MNGDDLRFGRIQDRLNLRLLISSQVQLFGDPLQTEHVARPVSGSAWTRLCLHNDEAPKRDRTGGCKC